MKNLILLISLIIANNCYGQFYKEIVFDSIVSDAMHKFEVPGLSITIFKEDSIILKKGFGVRKIGTTNRVDENTLFGIASISKSFTAFCLGILVDEHKLNWEDKVTDHLPNFQMYDPYVTNEITIKDLLIHNSGLSPISGGVLWYGSDYSREEIIKKMRCIEPKSSFRSEFSYQNIMYLAAGEVIKGVTDTTWDKYVEQRLFKPLKMERSNTSITNQYTIENKVYPHIRFKDSIISISPLNYDNIGPAASINTTANDITQYIKFILNRGKLDDIQIISESTMSEILKPRISITVDYPDEYKSIEPLFKAYGYGWFMQDYRHHLMYEHSGGIDGMSSIIFIVPDLKIGVAILTNQEESLINSSLQNIILDKLIGIHDQNWLDLDYSFKQWKDEEKKMRLDKINKEKINNTKPSLTFADYAGNYIDQKYGKIYVKQKNGELRLIFSHSSILTARIAHWHFDTFKIMWDDERIPDGFLTFNFNSKHEIIGFTMDQPNLLDVDFSELQIERIK